MAVMWDIGAGREMRTPSKVWRHCGALSDCNGRAMDASSGMWGCYLYICRLDDLDVLEYSSLFDSHGEACITVL
jgi:hypothetical protein